MRGSVDELEDGSGWTGHVDGALQVVREGIDLGRVPADW